MKTNSNIPEGYKDSPLGVIPHDWEVKRLREIANCFSGGTPKSENDSLYGGTIPFIRSGEIHDNQTSLFLTKEGFSSSSAKMVNTGDLIYALYGANSGDCAISKINGAINQAILCIRPKEMIINKYLQPYLEMSKGKYVSKYLQGGQGNLSGEIVASYLIAFPVVEEQIRISNVLNLWDEEIERQVKLCELLERRKRGLMQQLLSRKKRLKGFKGEWEKVRLGEITNRVTRENTEGNSDVMTISAQKGFVAQTDFFNKTIASDMLNHYYLVYQDEFCYNKSYCNGYPMGAIKRLKNNKKAVVTTLYICFGIKSDNYIIDFFEQYFESGALNKHLMKIANEGGRAHGLLNVTPSDFFNITFEVPSLAEQQAITEVLSAADQEISIAKQQLESLRKQKRGLMQQLLTGKKRLIHK